MGRVKQQRVHSRRARTRRRATIHGKEAWEMERMYRNKGRKLRYYAPGDLKREQKARRREWQNLQKELGQIGIMHYIQNGFKRVSLRSKDR